MGIRALLSKPVAWAVVKRQQKWMSNGGKAQQRVFQDLLKKAAHTQFGKDHHFDAINDYDDFKKQVPIRDYEGLRTYIDRVVAGEKDILWPGIPTYLAKTSGTTSGVKYIPITQASIPNHINGARDALLNYIYHTGKSVFLDGKLIFLSGSPEMEKKNGIHVGRLSGIVNHHVPAYLRSNQMPTYNTNCIEDWEEKVERIIDETLQERMTLISGIPPWVQMYFDRIRERTGKKIKDVFPDFSLFVYGGVNFDPYRNKLQETIGKPVDSIETYPASEGFIAFQDEPNNPGLLILLDSGIFYEFIPAEHYFDNDPPRYRIDQIELGKNYAVIINNNAGLWGYSLGDTVKFVNKDPYRLLVTGRIKHFISAFGEHVIGQEVENALKLTMEKHPEVEVVEFTVAPQVTPAEGLPLHQWYMEFARAPADLAAFEKELNLHLQKLNTYYDDLITGKILRPLEIISLKSGAFKNYMKSKGKLGGQNKVPRLANDRCLAKELEGYRVS